MNARVASAEREKDLIQQRIERNRAAFTSGTAAWSQKEDEQESDAIRLMSRIHKVHTGRNIMNTVV